MTKADREMWAEAYRLHDKYQNMTGSDEEWTACANECAAVCDKYNNSSLIMGLIQAVYAELEKMVNKKKDAA